MGTRDSVGCHIDGRDAYPKTHAMVLLRGHQPKRGNRPLANAKSSTRTRRAAKAHCKAMAWTMADPLESFVKGYLPRDPWRGEDDEDTLGRHDWWNNVDVIGLDDPGALAHFLDNCDHLLEASDSRGRVARPSLGTQGVSRSSRA